VSMERVENIAIARQIIQRHQGISTDQILFEILSGEVRSHQKEDSGGRVTMKPGLQYRPAFTQEQLTQQRDGWKSILHAVVMELLQ
jgi:hypothetical protein